MFTVDNEDTAIWLVDNEVGDNADTLEAAELELIGIIQGDVLTAAEMADVLI